MSKPKLLSRLSLRIFLVACLFSALAISSASSSLAETPSAGKQVLQNFDMNDQNKLAYWIYLPEDYSADKKYPLVLFLHGMGERGENRDLVLFHGPPKLVKAGEKFPFILVSPQLSLDYKRWQVADLTKLLDDVEKNYAVDQDRVYVTGLSMGGMGTWALGIAHPERFAALAPICGGGDASLVEKLKDVPIWTFHGTADTAVPFSQSQAMVDTLKIAKGNIRFTIYEGVGHNSWSETYNNQELYQWLLKQRRK